MKNILTSVVASIVVVACALVFFVPQVQSPSTGAITGPDVFSYMSVHGVFSQGGAINATSTTDTTEIIQPSDLADYIALDLTPLVGATTYQLPASTTFPGIPYAGDYRKWVIRNATTTATNITISATTGVDLQEPDGQNVVIGTTNFAWVTCYRKLNTDVVCLIDESIPAD